MSDKKAKKKKTIKRRVRRFLRRHPRLNAALPLLQGALAFVVVFSLAFGLFRLIRRDDPQSDATVEALARQIDMTETIDPLETADPEETPVPTPVVTEEPTVEPTATPNTIDGIEESYYYQDALFVDDAANNDKNGLIKETTVYIDTTKTSSYRRETDIHAVPSSLYTALEGVTTFRGSDYRDGGAYGTIPENPTSLEIVWSKKTKGLGKWRGVGWTGQASVIRWTEDLRRRMNINADKIDKDGLIEAIYATLDGHIYFLDLEDGKETRSAINIGAPVKGSLTVDPRGIPLLYCGQGIYEVNGKKVECGTRVWSLYDQSLLYTLNGKDSVALRKWYAFDGSPIIDAASDTMITAGENGVFYTVKLNTVDTGSTVSISPEVVRYTYTQKEKGKLGTENSVALYNHYAYFATNVGVIQCVDLNTMRLVWTYDGEDDIDASIAIEVEPDGTVALYVANEQDKRGSRGRSQMFKLNALTGALIWRVDSDKIKQNDENGGGSFATPAIGKGTLSDLVYFHVARTQTSKGMLYALDKKTGETVWSRSMASYGWSSPTPVYAPSGKGYLLIGSANGRLRLLDGLTGEILAEVKLDGVIEGSPAVFDDMLIIGTRASWIYGIKIK